jgi:hypothetical protein
MPNFLNQIKKNHHTISNITHYLKPENKKCSCYTFFHKDFKFLNTTNTSQFFYLGYILMICGLGGIKVPIMEYIENISYPYIKELLSYHSNIKSCCFFHLLTSMEEHDPNLKRSKFSLSSFINNQRYSQNFIDFLCKCLYLDFDQNSQTNLRIISNHPWLRGSIVDNIRSYVKVSMKELIKLTKEKKKENNINLSKKKLDIFLNNLEIIVSNNQHITEKFLAEMLESKKWVLNELSSELGTNYNQLSEFLNERIINSKQK